MEGLWLAVDKVIHHNDVVLPIIIRPRGDVATRDPHPGDACILKHDTEEGKTPIARRGRNEAAEQKVAVQVEVFHQRAGLAVSLLLPWPAPIRLVYVREDRAETAHRCHLMPIGTGHEKESFGDVAPQRGEQAKTAEGAEVGFVVRIAEEHCKARWSRLRKAYPRRGEQRAAGV